MADDTEAWHRSLGALDEEAADRFGRRFAQLSLDPQGQLVQAVQDADRWHGFVASHLWSLWTRYACAAFYSHPWAWNEIGFGGPAYPRGYKNLGVGRLEPWERRETGAVDPVPWARRVEAAKRAHDTRFTSPGERTEQPATGTHSGGLGRDEVGR